MFIVPIKHCKTFNTWLLRPISSEQLPPTPVLTLYHSINYFQCPEHPQPSSALSFCMSHSLSKAVFSSLSSRSCLWPLQASPSGSHFFLSLQSLHCMRIICFCKFCNTSSPHSLKRTAPSLYPQCHAYSRCSISAGCTGLKSICSFVNKKVFQILQQI